MAPVADGYVRLPRPRSRSSRCPTPNRPIRPSVPSPPRSATTQRRTGRRGWAAAPAATTAAGRPWSARSCSSCAAAACSACARPLCPAAAARASRRRPPDREELPVSDGDREFPPQTQEHPGSTEAMEPEPHDEMRGYRAAGHLEGRRALVTGGDSGIGRAVAIAFAMEGADVAVVYLSEDEDAGHTCARVEEAGRRAAAIRADLTREE